MILLFDIGNTNTHVGLANHRRIVRHTDLPTAGWVSGKTAAQLGRFVGKTAARGAAVCSVVPRATPRVRQAVAARWGLPILELTPKTLRGVGIDYPKPRTIGPDRLANAAAARHHFGAPVVVVDFGTAVTFDVVDERGNYVGGIIAPGLAAMTDYLHEKTALLPRIRMREVESAIGRSTEHAMLVGARAWVSRPGAGIDLRTQAGVESAPVAGCRHRRLRGIDCRPAARDFRRGANLTLEGLDWFGASVERQSSEGVGLSNIHSAPAPALRSRRGNEADMDVPRCAPPSEESIKPGPAHISVFITLGLSAVPLFHVCDLTLRQRIETPTRPQNPRSTTTTILRLPALCVALDSFRLFAAWNKASFVLSACSIASHELEGET